MRRRHDLVCEPDDRCIVEHPLAYPDALRMFEVMWQEGVDVGILPGDPWAGIETDLRLARVLNACSRRSCSRSARGATGPGRHRGRHDRLPHAAMVPDGTSLVAVVESYADESQAVVTGSSVVVVDAITDGGRTPTVITPRPLVVPGPGQGVAGEPTWTSTDRIMLVAADATGERIAWVSPDGSGLERETWLLHTPRGSIQRTHATIRPTP